MTIRLPNFSSANVPKAAFGIGWARKVGVSGFPLIGGYHDNGGEEAEEGRSAGE